MFWNDLNFFAFIHFVIGVISIVLGIAVFFKSTKNDVNRIFGLFSLGVAVWSFSYAIWLLSKSHDAALFWSRTLNLGATFIPVLYFHWVITVIKKDKKKLLIVYYFITFLFAFFSYSDIYIKGVKPILAFPYWPQANWLYILFLLFGWCNIFLYGLFLLIKELKNSTGSYHEQIKYVLFGSSIGLVGGSTNFFLMLGADWVHPIGSSLVVAYPLIFSYTIVKHRLMDIKVFAAQLFIIALNLIAFVYIFVSDSVREYVVKIIFFIGTLFISFLLYKSFNKEVQRKEELQKLSDKLEDANEQLKKLDRAKSEFISIASHQLRTPLTAIKGYVSLIIEGTYGKIDKKIKEALSKVYVSNERLIQLVENLLNISRIESGKIEYKYDNWQIEKIIKELTDNFIFAAKKKKLYLHLDLPKHPLPMIRIDG
ncbi:MAG TPA: sensor histidine kinase, partial [Candidatus Moranbacteria bacterium]|nr:sensor histidine kinase [Candidatus Moranbacteria bacterium]